MNWNENYWKFHQDMFIVFIELKIIGSWAESPQRDLNLKGDFMVSRREGSEIQIIAPDGLRRHLSFKEDAIVSINQNILTYNHEDADEITVDENEQAGKGKNQRHSITTRQSLLQVNRKTCKTQSYI